MTVRKIAIAGVILASVLGGTWEAASPTLTVHAMQKAAAKRDAARFSSFMDFPALRGSLRIELERRMTRPSAGDRARTPARMQAAAVATAMADRVATAAATPEAIAAAMGAGRAGRRGIVATMTSGPIEVRRTSWSEFTVSSATADATTYVFTRRWPEWRLTGVRLK